MKRMLVVAAALLLSVGAGIAQQDVVKQTQADMKANGKALGGVLTPMVKGDKPYDQARSMRRSRFSTTPPRSSRPCSPKAPRA